LLPLELGSMRLNLLVLLHGVSPQLLGNKQISMFTHVTAMTSIVANMNVTLHNLG
jgi:hypothetical protein